MLKSLTAPLFVLVFLLTACSASIVQIDPTATYTPTASAITVEHPDHVWWQFRFKLQWPEGESPVFSNHLLIADQIIAPERNWHAYLHQLSAVFGYQPLKLRSTELRSF